MLYTENKLYLYGLICMVGPTFGSRKKLFFFWFFFQLCHSCLFSSVDGWLFQAVPKMLFLFLKLLRVFLFCGDLYRTITWCFRKRMLFMSNEVFPIFIKLVCCHWMYFLHRLDSELIKIWQFWEGVSISNQHEMRSRCQPGMKNIVSQGKDTSVSWVIGTFLEKKVSN